MTNRKIPATELDRTKFKKYKLPKAYQEELLKTASFCIICISDGSVDSNRDAFQELAAISLLIENFLTAPKYKLWNDHPWARQTAFFYPDKKYVGNEEMSVDYLKRVFIQPNFVLTRSGYFFSIDFEHIYPLNMAIAKKIKQNKLSMI